MPKLSVILADDHPVIRMGIRSILERTPDIEVVAETGDSFAIVPLVEEYKPDVLVLDIEMPKISGIEITHQLKSREIPVRILVLSAHVSQEYVTELISIGVAGYLVKDEAPDFIAEAIRGIANGQQGWMSRKATAQIGRFMSKREESPDLTPRELEVLGLVSAGKSNQEIAASLRISESTVEKHVGSVLKKLDVVSRVEAAVMAVRRGWV